MQMTITIADGRGALWQWDTGRSLRVGSGAEQIHYQNKYFGRSVDVDVGADGTAIIPDELLQDCHPLTAYAYVTDDSGGYTKVQQEFIVNRRAKPAGYTYTPTDQMTLKAIQLQIGDLADLTTEAKDTLVAAINEVASASDAGSMALRVADGYIQYSTDSGSTWKNLIAVSELKGETGADGSPVNWRGAWEEDTEYRKLDAVSYDGSSYIFKHDTHVIGSIPGVDEEWGLMAQKGNDGADGITPVKGKDYWTEADKQEIVSSVIAALPDGTEVVY